MPVLLQGVFLTRDQTWVLIFPALAVGFFTISTTWEAHIDLCAHSLSCVLLFMTTWTIAHQAALSTGFPRILEWVDISFSNIDLFVVVVLFVLLLYFFFFFFFFTMSLNGFSVRVMLV